MLFFDPDAGGTKQCPQRVMDCLIRVDDKDSVASAKHFLWVRSLPFNDRKYGWITTLGLLGMPRIGLWVALNAVRSLLFFGVGQRLGRYFYAY